MVRVGVGAELKGIKVKGAVVDVVLGVCTDDAFVVREHLFANRGQEARHKLQVGNIGRVHEVLQSAGTFMGDGLPPSGVGNLTPASGGDGVLHSEEVLNVHYSEDDSTFDRTRSR